MAPHDTTPPRISEVTRRAIFDAITLADVLWSGRLDDDDFLARLYDLNQMPSNDYRYSTAARDIWQHQVNNRDWPRDWVFTDSRFDLLHCPDEQCLAFLCEMVHPVVQPDEGIVRQLLSIFNEHLAADGFQIVETAHISGRPTFAARAVAVQQPALEAIRQIRDTLTADYLNRQITRMAASIDSDPALAIGTAKELIETVCKTILRERGVEVDEGWEVPRLVRKTAESLSLATNQVPEHVDVAESIRRTLGNLAQVATGVTELRNLYGTGHGRDAAAGEPPVHHARLAVGAASTLVVFLFETHTGNPPSAAATS